MSNLSIVGPLIQQVLIMFLLMGVGFCLTRGKILDARSARDFGKLLINLVLPVIIFKSFWTEFSFAKLNELAVTFFLSATLLLLAAVVSHMLFRKWPIDNFASAFSNAGFIGIPLVGAVLGEDAVFLIACMIALLNAAQWTYGQYLLSGSKDCVNLRAIMTSPMVLSLIAGVVVFVARIPMIPIADSLLSLIAALNSPLAMLTLGIYLARSDLRALAGTKSLYRVSAVRLFAIPLLSLLLLGVVPCGKGIKLALLIAAATPTGANVAIFSQQLDKDYRYACGTVCITTLLSMLSMPLMIAVGQLVL